MKAFITKIILGTMVTTSLLFTACSAETGASSNIVSRENSDIEISADEEVKEEKDKKEKSKKEDIDETIIDMSGYAHKVDELKIPDDVLVVGIGEATHGNVEFQMLKLTVLQKMVAEGKCKSIAFEMPASDGAKLDECAKDKSISAEETVKKLMYPLYITNEMIDLVSWVQDYNENLDYSEQIRIYGIDMQCGDDDAIWIASHIGEDILEKLTEEEVKRVQEIASWDSYEIPEIKESDQLLFKKVLDLVQDSEDVQLDFVCKVLLQSFCDYSFEENPNAFGEYRDGCMAKNTELVEKMEAKRGFPQVVLTGHNGHLMRGEALSYGENPLGQRLAENYGDGYFVIGTEFYHADVNIHTAETWGDDYERKNHYFCSEDVIAAQAQYQEDGMFYLDFSEVTDENSELYQLLNKKCSMGMVGEGYSDMMMVLKSYVVKVVPTERYDAVIYVYKATPIDPIKF